MISVWLACVAHASPPSPQLFLTRAEVQALLGPEVVAACPVDQRCVFSFSDAFSLVLEPRGKSFVVKKQELWVPADRAFWIVQDAAGTRVPFPMTSAPPLGARWSQVADPEGSTPALAVQLLAQPTWHLPVDPRDLTVMATTSWPPLGRTGLRAGDRVEAMNGESVHSAEDLRAGLERAGPGPVVIRASRGGSSVEAQVWPDRMQLRCWKIWPSDGADRLVPPDAEPPQPAVRVECPPGAIGVEGVLPSAAP